MRGKLPRLCEVFKEASGDIILIQDADLEYDPVQYPQLLEAILNGETQVVKKMYCYQRDTD